MKIAVASLEKKERAEIAQQAGRAPYYLIFNEQGELLETWNNVFARGGGGAGFAVVDVMKEKEVGAIIAGKFGPNMTGAMDSAGIKYYEKEGLAKKAAKEVK